MRAYSSIDFHAHVLPGMDDGSGSAEESLRMLEASARQGIGCMAAVPHFDPLREDPERFLLRRAQSAARLAAVWRPGLPRLLPGAEVRYFEGMSRTESLEDLRIQGTSLLLLEMPFRPWTSRMSAEVRALQERPGFTVLLAHVERYFPFQNSAVWSDLLGAGILMQANAAFFLHWRTRHSALRLLRTGRIHLLGSDCHNMEERAPRLGEALEAIGAGGRRTLEETVRRLRFFEEDLDETQEGKC